jgi:murein L,D-transpeptidase YcbB/YkuD
LRFRYRRLFLVLAVWGFSQGALAGPADPPSLSPADRRAAVEALRDDPAERLGANPDDAMLWAALQRHAATELGQRISPPRVDPLWSLAPAPRQVDAEMRTALEQGRLAPWLASLAPSAPAYRALVAARARYALIVERGGWAPLPGGGRRRLGDIGPDIAALRVRLAVEDGSGPTVAAPETFDPPLQQALMGFQSRHGLVPDGVLGPGTRTELDTPAEQRLAQIDANLERWRWLPPLPADRVEVDIAGAEATLYRRGAAELAMRVIVGDPRHRSPMFASRIDSIVFNPPWKVPASIAAKELLPKEAAHPGYFARNDFHFIDGALQQSPGPKNALGRLKFDFNSPFGVYLHDTPGRAAFARPNRALSHGCIRLEKPRELAAAILPTPTWTPETIDAAIEAGTTLRVAVVQPVPLYVLYWSVVAAPDGQVLFRRDVYGWDAKLIQALTARRLTAEVYAPRPATECAASKAPQPVL